MLTKYIESTHPHIVNIVWALRDAKVPHNVNKFNSKQVHGIFVSQDVHWAIETYYTHDGYSDLSLVEFIRKIVYG